MGFHHVYDDAGVRECRWMINEIEEHMRYLINEKDNMYRRNKLRKERRERKSMNPENTEEISDDEIISSDDEDEEYNYEDEGEDEMKKMKMKMKEMEMKMNKMMKKNKINKK